MGRIHVLEKDGDDIYPVTVTDGVVDPETKKTVKKIFSEKADHGYASIEVAKTLKQVEDDTINTTEKPTAQSLSELNARVETLEALIENAEFSKMQTEIIDVISEIKMKGSPLIYVKDEAPSFAPDQLPQFYIDTAARKLYTARGTDSVSDWF